MEKYNNTKGIWVTDYDPALVYGIVYIDSNYIEFGYFEYSQLNIPIEYKSQCLYLDCIEHSQIQLYWRNSVGLYTMDPFREDNSICRSKEFFFYPIKKCYNFCKLKLKKQKYEIVLDEYFRYLNAFTFGLEYETNAGNIPWLKCLETNLVPLYDGSINGHEYVTFPLNYKQLPIVKTHLELLSSYTSYDKNCSLHIHFGGFPIVYDKIDALLNYWCVFQYIIERYIPCLSYYVELYKTNGKAYNKPYKGVCNLRKFYNQYTGNRFVADNDFYKPNRYDIAEERKWEVHGRYYNMNIMHLISNKKGKTVEFRFLQPTTNYAEIKWYILVLGAFLTYVIQTDDKNYSTISMQKVLESTYPVDIVTKIQNEGTKLYHLHKVQMTNRDKAGINDKLKHFYLSSQKFDI